MDVLTRNCFEVPYPIDPPTSTDLPVGHRKGPKCRSLDTPIRFEHNQPFNMRDGVTIRADVFRPLQSEPVPAIIIWGPYGKTGSGPINICNIPLRAGIPESNLSGYESFEGLDPAEWVPRGYAVVNVDARGSGDSEGDLRWWGSLEGQDGHDLVEHIAAQPWCSGRVSMAGNSWLAIVQWFVASQQPPHLACIAPMEGMSDFLRETICRGGIYNTVFPGLISAGLPGRQQQEDVCAMINRYPTRNEYWDDKRADMSKIKVPAYIVGSYSTNLHTMGAFRAFEEIPHSKKWLAVHSTQEWYDMYTKARTEDLAKFFDFYMKDMANDWEETPPVRLSLLGYNLPNEQHSFPQLPWAQPDGKKLRLHLSADQSMSTRAWSSPSPSTLTYQADVPAKQCDDDAGELIFKYTFAARTVLAGPSKLTVHVSSQKQDNLDVYVQLRKADAAGTTLQSLNMPLADLGVPSASELPPLSILKHLGPMGMLRASARAVAPELSCPHWDVLAHEKREPVPVGEVVKLEVFVTPTGMIFEAGESLLLKLSGHDMGLCDFPSMQGLFKTTNEGMHLVHFREGKENFLDLHII